MAKSIDSRVSRACDRLLNMFRTGDLPPAVARTTIQVMEGLDLPSSKWSLGNRLLMILAGTDDGRGFRQWQNVGRYVKKGAKAFYIFGPCTRKVTSKVTTEDGQETEEEKVIVTGFKPIPVFRYEDTTGKEIERPEYEPPVLPPLVEIAKAYGVSIKYGPFSKRFYGYYRSRSAKIMLCTHDVDVFFHELGHAIHDTIKPLRGGQDADQEIVAETVAAVLCDIYGYEGYIYQGYKYIQRYAGSTDKHETVKAIMRVLGDVQQVLEIILRGADKLAVSGA